MLFLWKAAVPRRQCRQSERQRLGFLPPGYAMKTHATEWPSTHLSARRHARTGASGALALGTRCCSCCVTFHDPTACAAYEVNLRPPQRHTHLRRGRNCPRSARGCHPTHSECAPCPRTPPPSLHTRCDCRVR